MAPTVICDLLRSWWLCWGSGAFTHGIVFLGCHRHLSQDKVGEEALSSFLLCILQCQGLGHTAPGPGWRESSALITTRFCLTSIQALQVEVGGN